jgi:EmrB/QacA subfamily drug resistance transporter
MTDARRRHPYLILTTVTVAGLAVAIQQSTVLPAITKLRDDLGTTTAWASWLTTITMLVSAVSTPVAGRLGDQFGKRRVLLVALFVFLAGSGLAAGSWSLASLIVARALQGVGGAMLPLGFAIVRDEMPPERVGLGMGTVGSVIGVGGAFGFVMSGSIVDNLSWRVLFLTGVPLVLVALVLIRRYLPESSVKAGGRIDYLGAVLLAAAILSLLLGLTQGASWGWSSAPVVLLLLAAPLLLGLWVRVERRRPDPLVDLSLLRHRPVVVGYATAFCAGFALFESFFLLPFFLQAHESTAGYGFGASATQTGLFLLPSSLTTILIAPIAGILCDRFGPRPMLTLGLLAIGLSVGSLMLWRDHPWQIVPPLILDGVAVALIVANVQRFVTESVPRTASGVAAGMATTFQLTGGIIGGQVGAVILTTLTIGNTDMPTAEAFTIAFGTATAAAFIGALITRVARPAPMAAPVAAVEAAAD